MKKTILLITGILLIACVCPLLAQNQIGIFSGINNAKITSDSDVKYETISVFTSGIVLDFKLKEKIYLTLQPGFIKKGGNQIDANPAIKVRESYLEIPVFLKYEFGDKINPYLLAGFSAGFLLDSKLEVEVGAVKLEADAKGVMKKMEFSTGFGGGFKFKISKFVLFLETKYMFGIPNINKGGRVQFTSGPAVINVDLDKDTKSKNRGLQFITGIAIPFGK